MRLGDSSSKLLITSRAIRCLRQLGRRYAAPMHIHVRQNEVQCLNWVILLLGLSVIGATNFLYLNLTLLPRLRMKYPDPGLYDATSLSVQALLDSLPLFAILIIVFSALLKMRSPLLRAILAGLVFFGANISTCYFAVWPHVPDFGNTWSEIEIVFELVLGMDKAIYIILVASFLGSILFSFKSKNKSNA